MQVLAFLLILAIILMVRLFMLTALQHDKWSQVSDDMSERSIYVEAPRGEIFDRYGRLLAGNRQSFSVRISGSGLSKEELNNNIQTLIGILDQNGDTFEDEFPIVIDGDTFRYTYQDQIDEWLDGMGFDTGMTAEEAFNATSGLGVPLYIAHGHAYAGTENGMSVVEAERIADSRMYEDKKRSKSARKS